MQLVCSNKPRPSVHKSGKGHEHWRRDVHHLTKFPSVGLHKTTLCNRDASEWLVIGDVNPQSAYDHNLCKRCLRKLMEPPHQSNHSEDVKPCRPC